MPARLRTARALVFGLLLASASHAQGPSRDLHAGWTVRALYAAPGSAAAMPVPTAVPGSVHRALMDAGRLADPLRFGGEAAAAWVDTTTWAFETTFAHDDGTFVRPVLVFDGIDTFADVYLNDVQVGTSESMFVPLEMDVREALRAGENRLRIVVRPALREAARRAAAHRYRLPESPRVFARKAQYSFGWDWGPRLVGAGLWRGVRLEDAAAVRIHGVSADVVRLRGAPRSDGTADADVRLSVDVSAGTRGVATVVLSLDGREVGRQPVAVSGGRERFDFTVRVREAPLWWPRGHGAATRMRLRAEVHRDDSSARLEQSVGLRTVEVDRRDGAFAFVVNGRRVFARGANTVPMTPFYPATRADHRRVLGAATGAHMNMVRVWGGGVFEADDFYDVADSLGLMVWQDFPFASAFYPSDAAFAATVEQEAAAHVRRLRRHPSIVLWCGGNEVWEGWTNWGWQSALGYSARDSAAVGAAYARIFEHVLGGVVQREGGGVPYWANSPSTGWGRDAAYRAGDVHYWGVWWGREPFERYRVRVGRFHSEYGMQAYPVRATVADFSLVLSEDDATFRTHQKHPTGFETLREYARQTFLPDTLALDRLRRSDLPGYAFLTQAMQAEGLGLAVAAHRAAAPRTMGTLVWQLNDVWPVVSWSSIDVYGRWKPLHHRLAALYRPLFADLVPDSAGTVLRAVVHSDTTGEDDGGALPLVLVWDAYDHRSGTRVGGGEVVRTVRPNEAETVTLGAVPRGVPRRALVVRLRLRTPGGDRVLLDARATGVVPWRLAASWTAADSASLRVEPDGSAALRLTSAVPVLGLWLEAPSGETLHPNYVDLWPGEPVRVSLPAGVRAADVSVRSLSRLLRHPVR